jgi:hypothetical protein
MTAPTLMSSRQLDAYAAFLDRVAGRRRGTLPDFLRKAARELREQWSFA